MDALLLSGYASAAQVRGDAFLARVRDNEEEFQRLDFTLREVSSSAPWVKARTRFPLRTGVRAHMRSLPASWYLGAHPLPSCAFVVAAQHARPEMH